MNIFLFLENHKYILTPESKGVFYLPNLIEKSISLMYNENMSVLK